ncbi:hypothetical protein SEA_DALANDE_64 [Gordonia phage DalanDe]|nr:hypothetical protein SEA_DALANDE_64 [Gordonia phage DalanDe]
MGVTKTTTTQRKALHIAHGKNRINETPVNVWICELLIEGKSLHIVSLDCVQAIHSSNAEQWWIKQYPSEQLLNVYNRDHQDRGRHAMHTRWHTNRNTVSDTCEFCRKEKRPKKRLAKRK